MEEPLIVSIYRRLRYKFRSIISTSPLIYPLFARWKRSDEDGAKLIVQDTALVVEAFPRSGNTFAYFAFKMCQKKKIKLAHHFHAPSQLMLAAKWKKPALLIVRNPVDAVCSFVLRESCISPSQALNNWIHFHRVLLPYAESFVVASFEQVTSDFGVVIDRVNKRFGTDFNRFDHTEDNVEKCFFTIEERNAMRFGGGLVVEDKVARPSSQRKLKKRQVIDILNNKKTRRMLEDAENIYSIFSELW